MSPGGLLGLRRGIGMVFAMLVVLLAVQSPAEAAPCLVVNGNFTCFTPKAGCTKGICCSPFRQLCKCGFAAKGWREVRCPSYTFLFSSAHQAGGPGVCTQFGGLHLWCKTQNACGAQTIVAPPGGGNFLGLDANFQKSALAQCVTGLVVGKCYTVTFEWAGAQQEGFNGATCDRLFVELGSKAVCCGMCLNGCGNTTCVPAGAQSTRRLAVCNHGFTGWQTCSFTFKATATCETLSFLAEGGPGQVPPFVLLADVQLALATPEMDPSPSAVVPITLVLGVMLIAADQRRKVVSPEPGPGESTDLATGPQN